jgi:hypothetical protein
MWYKSTFMFNIYIYIYIYINVFVLFYERQSQFLNTWNAFHWNTLQFFFHLRRFDKCWHIQEPNPSIKQGSTVQHIIFYWFLSMFSYIYLFPPYDFSCCKHNFTFSTKLCLLLWIPHFHMCKYSNISCVNIGILYHIQLDIEFHCFWVTKQTNQC